MWTDIDVSDFAQPRLELSFLDVASMTSQLKHIVHLFASPSGRSNLLIVPPGIRACLSDSGRRQTAADKLRSRLHEQRSKAQNGKILAGAPTLRSLTRYPRQFSVPGG